MIPCRCNYSKSPTKLRSTLASHTISTFELSLWDETLNRSDRMNFPLEFIHEVLVQSLTTFIICIKNSPNKKHSENADTYTSVDFELVVWHWPFVKVKKADVIKWRLLYCTLVPGMMSMGLILYEISLFGFFLCDLWPSPVTFCICLGHLNLSDIRCI